MLNSINCKWSSIQFPKSNCSKSLPFLLTMSIHNLLPRLNKIQIYKLRIAKTIYMLKILITVRDEKLVKKL
jgi:hypothetical protein